MKVVLKQDVKKLGKKGELVETSDGYARNYLFPRDLAMQANNQAMNELKNAESSKQFKIDTQVKEATANKERLEGKIFKMTAKAGSNGKLFGSVTAKEISQEIKKQYNIIVDKRKITLDTDIKAFGTYNASVKLYNGIVANIKVQVSEA
ncbi:MAG: 50S ribosomal protein L9 [Oscillospiraceae bacterium]|nr:50S ribosomal protein L9 [Oscillospiraceae bacterium]